MTNQISDMMEFFDNRGKSVSAFSFFGMDSIRYRYGRTTAVARRGVTTPPPSFLGIPLYKIDGETGVFAISICAVHDYLIPKYSKYDYRLQNRERLEERMRIKLAAFMKRFNLDYYSEVRENFNVWEAIDNAGKKGYVGVIVEDLS